MPLSAVSRKLLHQPSWRGKAPGGVLGWPNCPDWPPPHPNLKGKPTVWVWNSFNFKWTIISTVLFTAHLICSSLSPWGVKYVAWSFCVSLTPIRHVRLSLKFVQLRRGNYTMRQGFPSILMRNSPQGAWQCGQLYLLLACPARTDNTSSSCLIRGITRVHVPLCTARAAFPLGDNGRTHASRRPHSRLPQGTHWITIPA